MLFLSSRKCDHVKVFTGHHIYKISKAPLTFHSLSTILLQETKPTEQLYKMPHFFKSCYLCLEIYPDFFLYRAIKSISTHSAELWYFLTLDCSFCCAEKKKKLLTYACPFLLYLSAVYIFFPDATRICPCFAFPFSWWFRCLLLEDYYEDLL